MVYVIHMRAIASAYTRILVHEHAFCSLFERQRTRIQHKYLCAGPDNRAATCSWKVRVKCEIHLRMTTTLEYNIVLVEAILDAYMYSHGDFMSRLRSDTNYIMPVAR